MRWCEERCVKELMGDCTHIYKQLYEFHMKHAFVHANLCNLSTYPRWIYQIVF